jgi:hypothetical protein
MARPVPRGAAVLLGCAGSPSGDSPWRGGRSAAGRLGRAGSPGSASWVGPGARDEAAVPAQQGLRLDRETGPAGSGQDAADGGEQGPVGGLELGVVESGGGAQRAGGAERGSQGPWRRRRGRGGRAAGWSGTASGRQVVAALGWPAGGCRGATVASRGRYELPRSRARSGYLHPTGRGPSMATTRFVGNGRRPAAAVGSESSHRGDDLPRSLRFHPSWRTRCRLRRPG